MKQLLFSLFLPVALSVTGCDNATMHMNTTEKSQSQKNLERAYSGKPVAPVQLEYQVLGEPQTGTPLTITLKITPAVTANRITINMNTNPELFIVHGYPLPEFSNLAVGRTVTHTIKVIPQADGKHYLHLNVGIDSTSGRSGTRSFSITFTTGNMEKQADLPSAVELQQADDGEKLIIQEGVETRTVNP
jgi:hypothetical protein